MVDKSDMIQTV